MPLKKWFGFVDKDGWTGVVLFFVRSGILWERYSDIHSWRQFVARRSVPNFPLYFLTLLLVVLAAIPGGTISAVLRSIRGLRNPVVPSL